MVLIDPKKESSANADKPTTTEWLKGKSDDDQEALFKEPNEMLADGDFDPKPKAKDAAAAEGATGAEAQEDSDPCAHLPVTGNIWTLAFDDKGTRRVQKAIEEASDDERKELLSELKGKVSDALVDKNANRVISQCITDERPQEAQFIIDEILRGPDGKSTKNAAKLARNKFACHTMQRLIEKCQPCQLKDLFEEMTSETQAQEIFSNEYGNHTLQRILEHGSTRQVAALATTLAHIIVKQREPWNKYCCAVLLKALENARGQARTFLANAIMRKGALTEMACLRYGGEAVRLAIQCAGDVAERNDAIKDLNMEKLGRDRYGKAVYELLGHPAHLPAYPASAEPMYIAATA